MTVAPEAETVDAPNPKAPPFVAPPYRQFTIKIQNQSDKHVAAHTVNMIGEGTVLVFSDYIYDDFRAGVIIQTTRVIRPDCPFDCMEVTPVSPVNAQ